MNEQYDAIVVGAGLAGLTSAAYLSKAGYRTLLCEKGQKPGGLVGTFWHQGFAFDTGIRAVENSGVLFPMLKQLGITLDLVPNRISVGIEDKVILIDSKDSVDAYCDLLQSLYPDNREEVEAIFGQIKLIMKYMEVQYGIDNPIFMDMMKDQQYLFKKVMPWLVRYALTVPKITKLNGPVTGFLQRYTRNKSLIDIIAQHFFHETPAYFALSYLHLYLDYHYPRGGTGSLVNSLVDLIKTHQGEIRCNTEIASIDAGKKVLTDTEGRQYPYRRLVWAADLNTLYRLVDRDALPAGDVKQAIQDRAQLLEGKTGNDSIFSVFMGVNLDKEYFANRCTAHFFYTPSRTGQSAAGPIPAGEDRAAVEAWLEKFFQLTTYEISIPVLRDSSLAPEGKTGLIVSVLFDYNLTRQVADQGWYDDFKALCEKAIIRVLDESVFPGLKDSIQTMFSSTPLTLAKLTGNHEGAITGWAFSNQPVPAESRLPKILNAVKTPIPGVYQAGQWTYSPSGLPVSLITGKIAADQAIKDLKKGKA